MSSSESIFFIVAAPADLLYREDHPGVREAPHSTQQSFFPTCPILLFSVCLPSLQGKHGSLPTEVRATGMLCASSSPLVIDFISDIQSPLSLG